MDLNIISFGDLGLHCYCEAVFILHFGVMVANYLLEIFLALIQALTYLLAISGFFVALNEIFLNLGLENALNFQIFNCHCLELI